jgi:CubicO group peptidase (beta-lactamase class C family)
MRATWWMAINFALLGWPAGAGAEAARPSSSASIDRYVRPYVDTNNFSGVVLVARGGKPVFAKSYGFADFDRRVPNTTDTKFHIASMSMQYTAAAALRLVMAKKLSLDTPVSQFLPDFPNARAITVRHLLTQTSGVRDINDLADYDSVLRSHQTPLSLVAKVSKLPPERAPGTYEGEEHSAFNLLALIIERRSGLPFADAVKRLVFDPLRMRDSGIDDDRRGAIGRAALGLKPVGVRGLAPADSIHWSAKAGNASAYTSAADQLRFVEGLFDPKFMAPQLRGAIFDPSSRAGYGWFKSNSTRFGEPVYSMNGRAPGFASALVYLPRERLFVVALSNIYASFAPDIAGDIAAMMLDRPYQPLALKTSVDPASLADLPAKFRFAQDFYQPNAIVGVAADAKGEVFLSWPSGETSPLIPTAPDRYVDRAYGVPVELVRDGEGRPSTLKYDKFVGQRDDAQAQ